jgi:group II intron reverse transcriptase/maturase
MTMLIYLQTKREQECMNQAKIVQKQMKLAYRAVHQPTYRFNNLYHLLHWDEWLNAAAQSVLSRPGSNTAGVDGKTKDYFRKTYDDQIRGIKRQLKSKSFTPQPVRRVLIPKANGKKRPLGIPALRDRIVQEAMRMALDPIYESDFQPYSFGFRKGRCTMDAIAVIMPQFNRGIKKYYVIEGDLKSYFDTVNHRKLLSILKQRIADKDMVELIHRFLKAGVLEDGLFAKTENGVPQGGIISPLLANVYLNEFDKWAEQKWHQVGPYERNKLRKAGRGTYSMVRYADDFVIVSNDTMAGIKQTKQEVKEYLEGELKLTLSEEKTKFTHVNEGFDFLGFHIQRVRPEGRWVVHLRPTENSFRKVKAKLKEMTTKRFVLTPEIVQLMSLNKVVKGWCEYYKYTSLHKDLEQVSRYCWHRYHKWLLKKFKGSRKQQLIREKTKSILGRERWYAIMKEADQQLSVYQWLPSPKELKRSRYRQKGRDGFKHPYLNAETFDSTLPLLEKGPDEALYHFAIADGNRKGQTNEWQDKRFRVLIRDKFRCQHCGGNERIQVHHKKGTKSYRMKDLEVVCYPCHARLHQWQVKNTLMESRMR